jgi:16S rRNA (cytosine1402-N4)-methyltransferase
LFDLGISSYQLDNEERGFSYRKNSPLDMRINQNEECLLKAFEIVNYYSFKDLSNIIFDNGEEKKSRLIAKKICEKRKKKKIENTQELVKIIASCFKTKGKKHPAKKTFQALRIFINKELKNLAEALEQSLKKVKKGGRIIVISFHSLEDRIVKKFFKNCEKEGGFRNITKKPIVPNSKEIEDNNRARSAKMRVLERVS